MIKNKTNALLLFSSAALLVAVVLETFVEPITLHGSSKMYVFDADCKNYKVTLVSHLVLTEDQFDITASFEESGVDGLFHVNYQIPVKRSLPFSLDTVNIRTNVDTNNITVNSLFESHWYRLSLREGNRVFLHKSLSHYDLELEPKSRNVLFDINGYWFTTKPAMYL
ncbi:hypothetical protein [Vibrio paucivorans]|uniref:Uncharacterized protein n=1 Tax=Vibrio paucivorans TaxID=2829489 RepID=A0A9X3HUD2_9VIBR|nr:hypothetical protein [Vibrio paucivorans]MCW8336519.1 hypothetical protein [Vibrio paucivorans]